MSTSAERTGGNDGFGRILAPSVWFPAVARITRSIGPLVLLALTSNQLSDVETVPDDAGPPRGPRVVDVRPAEKKPLEQKPLEQKRPPLPTPEKLRQLIVTFDKDIADLETSFGKAESEWMKAKKKADRFTAKYGTIDNPTVRMNPDAKYPKSGDDLPPYLPENQERHGKIVQDLYRQSVFLNETLQSLQSFDKKADLNVLLPKMRALMQEHPQLKTLLGTPQLPIDSPQHLAIIARFCAGLEMKDLFPRQSAINHLGYLRAEAELKTLRPDLFEIEHRGGVVVDKMAPAMKRIVSNYSPKSFPQVVIHPTEDDYTNARLAGGDKRPSGGIYDIINDVTETYAQQWLSLFLTQGHENGHVICRTSEQQFLNDVQVSGRTLDAVRRVIQAYRQARNFLADMERTDDVEQRHALYGQASVALDKTQDDIAGFSLDRFRRLAVIDRYSIHGQLDESVAHLFQGAMIMQYFDDPRQRALVFQIRNYTTRATNSGIHWGAFRLGEEILHEEKGDYVKAINRLSYVQNKGQLDHFAQRINQAHERANIDEQFQVTPWHMGVMKMNDQMSEWTISHLEENSKRRKDKEYPAELAKRIQTYDGTVAQLMREYLQSLGVIAKKPMKQDKGEQAAVVGKHGYRRHDEDLRLMRSPMITANIAGAKRLPIAELLAQK